MNDPTSVPEITPTALKERLDGGDVPLLVDVREDFEREIADLPEHGQLRIPTARFLQSIEQIDFDREVVLYCRSGSRSEWAARLLLERGHPDVKNLKGGILGWRAEVDPDLRAY